MQLIQGLYSDKDLAKALELTEVIDFHQTLDIDGIKASTVMPPDGHVCPALPAEPLEMFMNMRCCSGGTGAAAPLLQAHRGATLTAPWPLSVADVGSQHFAHTCTPLKCDIPA